MTKHGRLIDAEWLKESLHNFFTGNFHPITEDDIMAYIDAAQTEQRWIPVSESERLPEERHDVLITKEPFKINGYEHKVIKARRSVDPRSGKIEWWSPEFGALTDKAVLAWMPLPEPYKGGEQDE